MNSIFNSKQIYRNNLLEQRKNFNESLTYKANQIIFERLLILINSLTKFNDINENVIGIYWPLKGEPNLYHFFTSKDFNLALPRIEEGNLVYLSYKDGDHLEKAPFKDLYYPLKKAELIPHFIIMPGLAFSTNGYRLGFGRGYFDKYLYKNKYHYQIITIGVCFHHWLFEYLPFDKNDHKLDFILTEKIQIKTWT